MSPLEHHTIQEAYNPSQDTQAWMAFIVINHQWPNTTYASYDGYHCHGLYDHSLQLSWVGEEIKKNGITVAETHPFTTLTTTEIVNLWTTARWAA